MKKVISLILIIVMFSFVFVGCENSSTAKETEYQEKLMQQANNEVGMPDITEYYEKKLAKEIFEKRDDSKLVCYAYLQNMNGRLVFLGKCMGYGLPYSTQYTNPEKRIDGFDSTIPQADPNGLYGATGLSATWVMMIDDITGKPYIMYCEPNTIVTETKMPKRLIEEWSLPENY